MADESLLLDAAQAVYAAAIGEFIAARKDRVAALKADGHADLAAQVTRFKKPSASAALVNRLVRHDPDLVAEIAELGSRLRTAQSTSDAAELRAVDRERRELVIRAGGRAREVAETEGKPATTATIEDVEQTVWAALVDATAAATVRAGMLVRPLSPGGFGEVDVSDASAVAVEAPPDEPPPPRRRPVTKPGARSTAPANRAGAVKPAERPDPAERTEARRALEGAQRTARAAQDRLEQASRSADEAVDRRTGLEAERDDLRARLTAAEDALRNARDEVKTSRADLRTAERERRGAAAEVDRAVERLDRLDRA